MDVTGSEPNKENTPRIGIYPNFLSQEDWEKVNEYCNENIDKFEFVGYSDKVGWIEHVHTKDSSLKFQRSKLTDGDKQIDVSRHGDNYKISMHEPVNGDIYKILLWVLIRTRDIIREIYGNNTYFESGPWLSLAPPGDGMALHCDGVFLATQNALTDFSAVYYVNDDYEGGELSIPFMGLSIKPPSNSLVLWSHVWHEDMAHCVKPIISGNRFMSQGFFWSV
jgi:hypothetical protein